MENLCLQHEQRRQERQAVRAIIEDVILHALGEGWERETDGCGTYLRGPYRPDCNNYRPPRINIQVYDRGTETKRFLFTLALRNESSTNVLMITSTIK